MPRLALLLTCVSLRAAAAVPGLTLEWSAPPGCPSARQVEEAVERQVAGATAEPPITVTGRVGFEGRWQVELRNSLGGERVLTGSTCAAVSSAAVVVVALMVDPLAVAETPVLEAQAPLRWSIGLFGSADTHMLPALSPGGGLTVGLALPLGFGLELQGQAFLPQSTATTPGATLTLFTGALGARRDFELGAFFLAPVLALEAGALRGRSFGITDPAVNTAPWLAGRGGVALGFVWRFFRVGVRVEAVVPITRPRFTAAGVGELSPAPTFGGRGAFTLELLFPPRVGAGGGN